MTQREKIRDRVRMLQRGAMAGGILLVAGMVALLVVGTVGAAENGGASFWVSSAGKNRSDEGKAPMSSGGMRRGSSGGNLVSTERRDLEDELARARARIAALEEEVADYERRLAEAGALRGKFHIVRRGESLWRIARDQYGDPRKWNLIYTVNIERIGPDPNVLYPDRLLILPDKGQLGADS